MLRLWPEKYAGLRLRLEKEPAKPVPATFPVKTLEIFVLPQAQAKLAPAGFSLVHDEKRCWLYSGAHKGPIARM